MHMDRDAALLRVSQGYFVDLVYLTGKQYAQLSLAKQ